MKVLIVSVLLFLSFAAFAETESHSENILADEQTYNASTFNLVLVGGMTFGSNASIMNANSQTIDAGGFLYGAVGGVYHVISAMDMQATFGMHIGTTKDPGRLDKFRSSLVELIPYYVTNSGNRFGVGYTKILSPKYSDQNMSITFKDANGMIWEYDWKLMNNYYVDFRYVYLTYNDTNNSYAAVDGGYFGVMLQANFK